MPRGRPRKTSPVQTDLPLPESGDLSIKALETWLWDAACAIRGATDAPKFKDFILPLLFFKRLSDVFEDEMHAFAEQFHGEDAARAVVEADHAAALAEDRRPLVRFFVPTGHTWNDLRHYDADASGKSLGEAVTDTLKEVARLNPDLQGVLDVKDFAERQAGQRVLDDERLATLVEILSRHRLGLDDARPDVLGQAYEYLLRKFAEGQGQSAGEFFTPPEVGLLLGRLLDLPPKATVYDPTCGSGGLLIKARMAYERDHPGTADAPHLHGQELNPTTYAIARMNMALHDYGTARIAVGDTFKNPHFRADGAGLERFTAVVANPMWNQKGYGDAFFANDPWKRFAKGAPPSTSADWAWVQHIAASLDEANGRAAVVLDTGAVSRGSGAKGRDRERDLRKAFVEAGLIEGVVLLPENLFYNTTAPGILLVLRTGRPDGRGVLLVNASQAFVKRKPKNELTPDGADRIAQAFRDWTDVERFARVVSFEEIEAADYNLSPSAFVETAERAEHRAPEAILADLDAAKAARHAADERLAGLLAALGLAPAEVAA